LDRAVAGQDDERDVGGDALQAGDEVDAVAVGEPEVEDGGVRQRGAEAGLGVAAARRLLDPVAVGLEEAADAGTQARLVVHQGHRALPHPAPSSFPAHAPLRGSFTLSAAPPPGRLGAWMRPPWSSTIRAASANPSPVPPCRRVKKGSKTR